MDEIWHYGTGTTVAGIVGWLIRQAYRKGREDQKMIELAKSVKDFKEEISFRLGRIETLLMERKK